MPVDILKVLQLRLWRGRSESAELESARKYLQNQSSLELSVEEGDPDVLELRVSKANGNVSFRGVEARYLPPEEWKVMLRGT